MTWHSAFLKAFLSDSERYVIIRNCSRQYLSLERRHLPEGNQRNEGSIPFTRFRPLVPHGLPPWLKLLRTRPRAGSALNHGAASEAQTPQGWQPHRPRKRGSAPSVPHLPRGRCHSPRRFHSCLFVSIRGYHSRPFVVPIRHRNEFRLLSVCPSMGGMIFNGCF